MSRRTFLRRAFALMAGPAVLAAAGCGGGSDLQPPAKYTEMPPAATDKKVKGKGRHEKGTQSVTD